MRFPFDLPDDRDFDVAGFGTNAVDFLIRVPEYPEFNSKVELSEYIRAAGGEVATTMVGLQRLGVRTLYAGRFGDDDAGDFGRESLRAEGVDISLAESVAGARTQIAFIIIDERNGERTVIWRRDHRLAYSAAEAPLEIAERSRILHFTPHDAEACIALARRAKELGTIVSIDLDNIFPRLEELLPLVDILITSAELPSRMFAVADRHKALREMHSRYGSAVVGITLGEHGSLLYSGGQFVETKGFQVPGGCQDTTGAGDSFRAGLLYGVVNKMPVDESARWANAVAALKCRRIGARTSLPSVVEVTTLLKKH